MVFIQTAVVIRELCDKAGLKHGDQCGIYQCGYVAKDGRFFGSHGKMGVLKNLLRQASREGRCACSLGKQAMSAAVRTRPDLIGGARVILDETFCDLTQKQ